MRTRYEQQKSRAEDLRLFVIVSQIKYRREEIAIGGGPRFTGDICVQNFFKIPDEASELQGATARRARSCRL